MQLQACPKCSHEQPPGSEECQRCGIVFAKVVTEQPAIKSKRKRKTNYFRAIIVGLIFGGAVVYWFGIREAGEATKLLEATARQHEEKAQKYADAAKKFGPIPGSSRDNAAYSTYKNSIKQFVSETFFDPYSMRDVSISRVYEDTNGTLICFEANARNRMGAYVGRDRIAFRFKDGKLDGAIKGHPVCSHPVITYTTWPEMEGKN
jgi:hypothetical protein